MASSYSGGRLFLLSFFWPGLLVQDDIAGSRRYPNLFISDGNQHFRGLLQTVHVSKQVLYTEGVRRFISAGDPFRIQEHSKRELVAEQFLSSSSKSKNVEIVLEA